VEGESTSLYLQRQIKDSNVNVKMSRLARGIPVGVDLEYAKINLHYQHALEGEK
jgi:recombination protein RecR